MSIYSGYLFESANPVDKIENMLETAFELCKTEPNSDDIVFENIFMNEVENYNKLLESTELSDSDKKLIEEKVDVLLEFSFKDIKDKFSKILKTLKEKVQEIIIKIKERFKSKQLKDAEKKINDLEKKLKEKDITNEDLRKKYSDAESKAFASDMKAAKAEGEKEGTKLASKIDLLVKLGHLESKIINNKYLYFDIDNYLDNKKNITLQQYTENIFRVINQKDYKRDQLKEILDDLYESYSKGSITILTDDCLNRLKKYTNSEDSVENLSSSESTITYKSYEITKLIEDELEQELKNKSDKFNTIADLLDKLKTDMKNQNNDTKDLTITISQLSRQIGNIERNIGNLGYEKVDPKRASDEDTKNLRAIDSMKDSIKGLNEVIRILRVNINLLSHINNYQGRKLGACVSAITQLDAIASMQKDIEDNDEPLEL